MSRLRQERTKEIERLRHDEQRRQSRGYQLASIGQRLGITRYPGEEENAFFARIESHPEWEAVQDEVRHAMRLQKAPILEEPERELSFIEELRRV